MLAPPPWIEAIWERQSPPRQILVAGCGTGNEAFALCERFPEAEIVAIDFCPRSIQIAKGLRRKNRRYRDIRFLVGDLSSSRLAKITGQDFDFISCHGVLSYIQRPAQVIRNLAGCLRDDGTLYLGVNGQRHFSVNWRPAISRFGLDLKAFENTSSLRQLLQVFDLLSGHTEGWIARRGPEYLAGDLFGPLNQSWSLARWTRICRCAELHLLSDYTAFRPLRRIFEGEGYKSLIPRSRADLALLFDVLQPREFHRLMFSRKPELRPPWDNTRKLHAWRPQVTPLYRLPHWPKKARHWTMLRNLSLKSPSTNTRLELRVPAWEIEILRGSNGKDSISDILRLVPVRIPRGRLRDQFYLLYQLGAINLLPPAS
jgi:SAM-dependent methyltransferase